MEDQFHAYIKFIGPENEDGAVDIAKAAKTMLALDRWTRKYQKDFTKEAYIELKISAVRKNCSELDILIQSASSLLPVGALTAVGATVWKQLGFQEFCKKFMGTLGEQLVLKKILKNDKPESISEPYLQNDKPVIDVVSKEGKKYTVSAQSIDVYRKTHDSLNGFNTLVAGQNTEMKVGYYETPLDQRDVAVISPSDREAFSDPDSIQIMEQRLNEGFDEDKAREVTLFGRFVDYRGMATKYKFSFQARQSTKKYGRQKILCIVDDKTTEASILDLLKPQNKKNVILNGLATKSWDGSLDKLKVAWFNQSPNYDPEQLEMFYLDSLDIEEKDTLSED